MSIQTYDNLFDIIFIIIFLGHTNKNIVFNKLLVYLHEISITAHRTK